MKAIFYILVVLLVAINVVAFINVDKEGCEYTKYYMCDPCYTDLHPRQKLQIIRKEREDVNNNRVYCGDMSDSNRVNDNKLYIGGEV